MTIQKIFFKNAHKIQKKQRENFRLSLDHRKEKTKQNIRFFLGIPNKITELNKAKEILIKLGIVQRWNIAEIADDPIFAVILHESWHVGYDERNLKIKWRTNLDRSGVTVNDWLKVSEYGALNISELFAEAASARDLGISIPANIKEALKETV